MLLVVSLTMMWGRTEQHHVFGDRAGIVSFSAVAFKRLADAGDDHASFGDEYLRQHDRAFFQRVGPLG